MILYGVTIDLQVVPVRLGSQQMMECRDVFNSEKEATAASVSRSLGTIRVHRTSGCLARAIPRTCAPQSIRL